MAPHPKHWVFDLDGTLVDSFSHYFDLLSGIFKVHGAQFTPDLRLPALTDSLPGFFERHLGQKSVPAALSALQDGSNEDALRIRPFEGMEAAVRRLSDGGARIAVWTNRDLTSAELILKHSGLERYVELCVSGTCVSRRKPHPEGLSRILKHFDCGAEAVTMVGDHEHDVLGAKALGARAVRASWHAYWEAEPCARSDRQFRSVRDFSDWIAK